MAAQHRQQSPTLVEFKRLLQTQWTSEVACQDNCHDPELPCPERCFVHVAELEKWWKRTASDSASQRKIDRLFDEHPLGEPNQLFQDSAGYGNACLRVLSLLLEHDLGHYIKRFYDSNMHDRYLERGEGYQVLRSNLNKIIPTLSEVDNIIQVFHNAKWAYCPLEFTFHMDKNLQGTEVIVPFCRKIRLGDKGATASIYGVAVQADLIRDDALRDALKQSIVNDPEFGECYQMALKSYIGNKESIYELERNAFSGLNINAEVPIVRCLGCYSHDYGEGVISQDPEERKTYNLLLEFGEQDLYEYWADETNIPPVRAEEIIDFWKSLFEVAKAIRHVHNLEIPRERGLPRKFHGWHADIKPDNILRVHGQFKLADFGLSKFAPVTTSERVPTEFINGFTDTYSAPEVSRAKRPDGTISEVTQSIDTWSFGCVLSVAATWVVLGFQGVRQYEKLRRLSPSNNKNGKTYDRFHNGIEVLPEVRRWHDYLRGHLRCSDTMTPHVLRLVENNMLQTSVRDRLAMTSLCSQLESLVRMAQSEIANLDEFSRNTDDAVLRALLEINNDAERQISSKPKSTLLIPSPAPSQPIEALRSSQKCSKTERLKSIPLGHTTYRTPIIMKELSNHVFIEKNGEKSIGGTHEGAITHSPVHDHSASEFPEVEREEKPRNPGLEHKSRDEYGASQKPVFGRVEASRPKDLDVATAGIGESSRQAHGDRATPHYGSIRREKQPVQNYNRNVNDFSYYSNGSPRRPAHTTDGAQSGGPQSAPDIPVQVISSANARDESIEGANPTISAGIDVLRNFQTHPDTHHPVHESSNKLSSHSHTNRSPSTSSPQYPQEQYSSGYVRPYYAPSATDIAIPMARSTSASSKEQSQVQQLHGGHVPQLNSPTPRRTQSGTGEVYELNSNRTPQGSPGLPQPDIFITQATEIGTSDINAASTPSTLFATTNQTANRNQAPGMTRSSYNMKLPTSPLELPYPICEVRRQVDAETPKGVRTAMKGLLGREQRKADKSLAETYGDKREIVGLSKRIMTVF
ncbi:hypothetical protein BKA63DRAFT_318495 [Paraphoma chrysanthemicola]|nr:hypothetical protein BKA63DRAFT_318495 [Paraphoma chrysanthemicola]